MGSKKNIQTRLANRQNREKYFKGGQTEPGGWDLGATTGCRSEVSVSFTQPLLPLFSNWNVPHNIPLRFTTCCCRLPGPHLHSLNSSLWPWIWDQGTDQGPGSLPGTGACALGVANCRQTTGTEPVTKKWGKQKNSLTNQQTSNHPWAIVSLLLPSLSTPSCVHDDKGSWGTLSDYFSALLQFLNFCKIFQYSLSKVFLIFTYFKVQRSYSIHKEWN